MHKVFLLRNASQSGITAVKKAGVTTNCVYYVLFAGQMPPVLARRALGALSVFCRWPVGTVQHAAVCLERVQSHWCTSKLTSDCFTTLSFSTIWRGSDILSSEQAKRNQASWLTAPASSSVQYSSVWQARHRAVECGTSSYTVKQFSFSALLVGDRSLLDCQRIIFTKDKGRESVEHPANMFTIALTRPFDERSNNTARKHWCHFRCPC